jgi:hypothetical protein
MGWLRVEGTPIIVSKTWRNSVYSDSIARGLIILLLAWFSFSAVGPASDLQAISIFFEQQQAEEDYSKQWYEATKQGMVPIDPRYGRSSEPLTPVYLEHCFATSLAYVITLLSYVAALWLPSYESKSLTKIWLKLAGRLSIPIGMNFISVYLINIFSLP